MRDLAPTELLGHFFRISRLLAGQLDIGSAIRSIAAEIAVILPHDHLDVCIIRADGKLHTAYETGLDTAWGAVLAPVAFSPIRSLLLGEVDHILTDDACTDPRFHFPGAFHHPILEHSLRARIHVGLTVQGVIIGALSVSSQKAGLYNASDVHHAGAVADLLAPYFFALRAGEQAKQFAVDETEARAREEGLRLGALKLTEALEQERQRIGMDLHDQTLADMTRLSRRLERLIAAQGAQARALVPVALGLQQCMSDLRQIIEQAKPSILHLFGFAQAVENHLERAVQDSPLPLDWTLNDESDGAFDRLDTSVSMAMFRIAQEAINNAVIHAQATQLTVRLHRMGKQVALGIGDNGMGLPKRRARAGSGINNMKTRARLISARFSLSAGAEGGGTQVTVTLPLMVADVLVE